MYCLDSNVFVALFRGDKNLKSRIESLDPNEISTTSISLAELFKGAFHARSRGSGMESIKQLAANYEIFPFDAQCAMIFADDFTKLETAGKPTQDKDLMIASVAKRNGLVLVTRNKKHFENIPELKIEEW